MTAGVQLRAALLQTEDLDTLLQTKTELKLAGSIRSLGLLCLLQKIDKSFGLVRQWSFRAINEKGLMIDLIQAPADGAGEAALISIGTGTDPVAEPLQGLEWLTVTP
jgi:hypothetical protein